MDKINQKKVDTLIHKLGLKYKLSDSVIKELVESPYEFSALIIKKLTLDELEDYKEIENIKTNFMYSGFAKLFINPLALKKRLSKKIDLNK